jgi:hypothetical protein
VSNENIAKAADDDVRAKNKTEKINLTVNMIFSANCKFDLFTYLLNKYVHGNIISKEKFPKLTITYLDKT